MCCVIIIYCKSERDESLPNIIPILSKRRTLTFSFLLGQPGYKKIIFLEPDLISVLASCSGGYYPQVTKVHKFWTRWISPDPCNRPSNFSSGVLFSLISLAYLETCSVSKCLSYWLNFWWVERKDNISVDSKWFLSQCQCPVNHRTLPRHGSAVSLYLKITRNAYPLNRDCETKWVSYHRAPGPPGKAINHSL